MICKVNTVLGRDRVGGYAARIDGHVFTGGAAHTSHGALSAMAQKRVEAVYGKDVQFVISGPPRAVSRSSCSR